MLNDGVSAQNEGENASFLQKAGNVTNTTVQKVKNSPPAVQSGLITVSWVLAGGAVGGPVSIPGVVVGTVATYGAVYTARKIAPLMIKAAKKATPLAKQGLANVKDGLVYAFNSVSTTVSKKRRAAQMDVSLQSSLEVPVTPTQGLAVPMAQTQVCDVPVQQPQAPVETKQDELMPQASIVPSLSSSSSSASSVVDQAVERANMFTPAQNQEKTQKRASKRRRIEDEALEVTAISVNPEATSTSKRTTRSSTRRKTII